MKFSLYSSKFERLPGRWSFSFSMFLEGLNSVADALVKCVVDRSSLSQGRGFGPPLS